MPQLGGGPQCPVCSKTVYFNEERRAIGKVFHIKCFRCSTCGKSLDSTNCNEHESSVYCKGCYGKSFGPSGYGFAGGAAGLSTGAGSASNMPTVRQTSVTDGTVDKSDANCCPRCGQKVYFAEQVIALNRKWHRPCFKCAICKKSVDSSLAADHEGELYCKSCYGRQFGPAGYGYGVGAGTLQTK